MKMYFASAYRKRKKNIALGFLKIMICSLVCPGKENNKVAACCNHPSVQSSKVRLPLSFSEILCWL